MSGHLRIVRDGPLRKPRERQRARHEDTVLSPEEQTRARQALRNLKDAYGTLGCMAAALGLPRATLQRATAGTAPVSPAVLLRAMKASGLSLADLLGAPIAAGRCRACGAIKRLS